uniref:Uncharacterized protein n=1 Tax=Parascaris univalens TaxID=6257 RepID=A0A915BH77_PARUN
MVNAFLSIALGGLRYGFLNTNGVGPRLLEVLKKARDIDEGNLAARATLAGGKQRENKLCRHCNNDLETVADVVSNWKVRACTFDHDVSEDVMVQVFFKNVGEEPPLARTTNKQMAISDLKINAGTVHTSIQQPKQLGMAWYGANQLPIKILHEVVLPYHIAAVMGIRFYDDYRLKGNA